jgi:hypothetical protein
MWKIDAPVVNPELLKKTRRFRWAAWEPACCDNILDYLKVYREHPEIELLSKSGMGRYCTKVTIVRKLKTDKAFRQFFMLNADAIKRDRLGADVIIKAYHNGVSLADAVRQIAARRGFRYCNLPRNICALKASSYINKRSISRGHYADYLSNCRTLGMNLSDTKVSFPKNFKERSRITQDMVDAIRRQQKAEEIEKMNRQLESVAKKWSRLERNGRDYRIVIPRTEQEFIDAGRAMANCLGQYSARVARGELVVVFVRMADHPRKAFVAAAYDPKTETVKQCYGVKNSKPPKPVTDFVNRVFARLSSKKQLKVAA